MTPDTELRDLGEQVVKALSGQPDWRKLRPAVATALGKPPFAVELDYTLDTRDGIELTFRVGP